MLIERNIEHPIMYFHYSCTSTAQNVVFFTTKSCPTKILASRILHDFSIFVLSRSMLAQMQIKLAKKILNWFCL